MRKILIAAVAALMALAVSAVAIAQTPTPGAELTMKVSPSKVGTKKKPKPAKISLEVINSDSSQTADGLKIYQPKNLIFSGKGLKKCKLSALEETTDPASCPSASKLGTGKAEAIAGVNGASPSELTFNVTAFLTGDKQIAFLIQQQGGGVNAISVGNIKKGSGGYGSVLDISIPEIARFVGTDPATRSYNGLKSIQTTLYKKVGSKSLYKTNGCPSSRELSFKTTIHFQANPNPPKATTVTATDGADCKK